MNKIVKNYGQNLKLKNSTFMIQYCILLQQNNKIFKTVAIGLYCFGFCSFNYWQIFSTTQLFAKQG